MNLTQIVDGCSLTGRKTHKLFRNIPKIVILTRGLEGDK